MENLLCIITNDGWWDDTPGYKQHLSYAKLRAIETRRDVARSANTGMSAFINQKGEITYKSSWWVEAEKIQQVKLNNQLTFYSKHGDYLALAAVVALLSMLGMLFVWRK
jgi:apolipoprotein N-acyltransferase